MQTSHISESKLEQLRLVPAADNICMAFVLKKVESVFGVRCSIHSDAEVNAFDRSIVFRSTTAFRSQRCDLNSTRIDWNQCVTVSYLCETVVIADRSHFVYLFRFNFYDLFSNCFVASSAFTGRFFPTSIYLRARTQFPKLLLLLPNMLHSKQLLWFLIYFHCLSECLCVNHLCNICAQTDEHTMRNYIQQSHKIFAFVICLSASQKCSTTAQNMNYWRFLIFCSVDHKSGDIKTFTNLLKHRANVSFN